MIEQTIHWLLTTISFFGYPGIILLMAMESSFFPIPSELVMPPAGYLASIREMDLSIALLCGTIGSVLGAVFNYYLGYHYGKKLLLRFGKYILLTPERYQKSEDFFLAHGNIATFLGRLLLGIRHFISFPAGVARMPLVPFIGYTAFGSLLWCGILVALGYVVGQNEESLKTYYHQITYGLIVFCLLTVAVYFFFHKRKQHSSGK